MTHIDGISLFGHAHKLKIIKLTNKQYQNCISTGLVIIGQNVFDWTQNSKGKVYQGIFGNIKILSDGEEQGDIDIEDMEITEKLGKGPHLIFYDTARMWLKPDENLQDTSDFQMEWDVLEIDEDSEPYLFGRPLMGGIPMEIDTVESVDEGFILVDGEFGVRTLHCEEDDDKKGFTLSLGE